MRFGPFLYRISLQDKCILSGLGHTTVINELHAFVILVSIDSIQEVCEGKQSEIFQRHADGSFDPNCCFSIYYGDHMESLDLVSSSGEEARTWITGLKYLMAGISDEDSLSKRQRTRDQYPSHTILRVLPSGGDLSIA